VSLWTPRPIAHLAYEHMFYLSSSSSTHAKDLRVLFLDRARSALHLTIAFLTLQDDYDAYWDQYPDEESDSGRDALTPSPRQRRHPHHRPLQPLPTPRRAGEIPPPPHSCLGLNVADVARPQDEPRSIR
jgi:hypothetical protein